jgi:hypothetical protein
VYVDSVHKQLPPDRSAAGDRESSRQQTLTHSNSHQEDPVELHNTDGIAAARTMIALEANATALQSRLPGGWVLAPYAGDGTVRLSLSYRQGGALLWVTADEPNLRLQAAKQPGVVRWYQEDQVLDVVRSDPLNINHVTEISLEVEGELADVFDGNERVVGVVIQRPYMRQVFEPVGQG